MDEESDVICYSMGDGTAAVPMSDYEAARRQIRSFRRCLASIGRAFRVLEIEATNGWHEHKGPLPDEPEWTQPTEPAPLGD